MKYVFKGKGKISGMWHYGDLIQGEEKMWIIETEYLSIDGKIELATCVSPEVDPKTVKLLRKCDDEEWPHCQVEKRGCKGCFYNHPEAEGENDGRCTKENI